jgi:DNA invertase Pin-like site-specific DNA recombinase
MGRKAKLDPEQIEQIRNLYAGGTKVTELAKSYGISVILCYRVINRTGAYKENPVVLGTPILNANGEIINVIPPTTQG